MLSILLAKLRILRLKWFAGKAAQHKQLASTLVRLSSEMGESLPEGIKLLPAGATSFLVYDELDDELLLLISLSGFGLEASVIRNILVDRSDFADDVARQVSRAVQGRVTVSDMKLFFSKRFPMLLHGDAAENVHISATDQKRGQAPRLSLVTEDQDKIH